MSVCVIRIDQICISKHLYPPLLPTPFPHSRRVCRVGRLVALLKEFIQDTPGPFLTHLGRLPSPLWVARREDFIGNSWDIYAYMGYMLYMLLLTSGKLRKLRNFAIQMRQSTDSKRTILHSQDSYVGFCKQSGSSPFCRGRRRQVTESFFSYFLWINSYQFWFYPELAAINPSPINGT